MKIASFDIGTTAVKGVLLDENGRELYKASRNIHTYQENGRKEQDPEEWYEAFHMISQEFFDICDSGEIEAVIMSGQMQDVIPVDRDGKPVGRAILYSDGRGEPEAEELIRRIGNEKLFEITGNHMDGSLSFPKMMWMRSHQPTDYEKIDCFLLSSKDYVIRKLTGKNVSDVTTCSTAGAMDIYGKQWDENILLAGGIEKKKLPEIRYAHELAGRVTKQAAEETGYQEGTRLYAGTGDAGATTLASGISQPGEFNINLGTSGWVATISESVMKTEGGVFNLAAMPEAKYINVVPFLNAGNVHKWICRLFSENDQISYDRMNELLKSSTCGANGLLFLPYLNGERFPVLDSTIKGSFYGITMSTTKQDMLRSCLEGVAFSIRQGIEKLGIMPKKVSVIGGGGRVSVWCQILADVLKQELYVYPDSETLPAKAIAFAALLGEGKIKNYGEITEKLQSDQSCLRYSPDKGHSDEYDIIYQKYLKLYPALKGMEEW